MRCPTGKISYNSCELAEEALIQNHIRNDHRQGAGPINVYQCDDCNEWHFTSSPPQADLFSDEKVIERIRSERRSLDWERRLK